MKPADTSRFMAHDTFCVMVLQENAGRQKGVVTADNVKEILAVHKDYPDSICRHEDELDPDGLRMCTVFSIVMDMTTLKWSCCVVIPVKINTGKFRELEC